MKNLFVIVSGRHFSAKISGKMPALPHTCAQNYNSAQFFVVKTIPQNPLCYRDSRGLQSSTN